MCVTLIGPTGIILSCACVCLRSGVGTSQTVLQRDAIVGIGVTTAGNPKISDSARCFVSFVTPQGAGAAVPVRHFGRQGVARAPQIQFCECRAGPCRARGGYRAAVSVACTLVAQDAVRCPV